MLSLIASSCNIDEVIEAEGGIPQIQLEPASGIFTAKVCRPITITPTYVNVDNSTIYAWSSNGEIVSSQPTYTFTPTTAEKVYLRLEVTNQYGSAKRDLRVDVVERDVAKLSLAGSAEGFTVAVGDILPLRPHVEACALPIKYSWSIDGEAVCAERDYDFAAASQGSYRLALSASTDDGTTEIAFDVRVVTAEEMPLGWHFEQTEYNVAFGRTILLQPFDIVGGEGAEYEWSIGAEIVSQSKAFEFSADRIGRYDVSVAMRRGAVSISQSLIVNVCAAEGEYRRTPTAASLAACNKVYELRVAPGQFINEYFEASTAEEACRKAEERIAREGYISLGGFGGYIVVGFDHSITATGGYDFAVRGNTFDGSSEPGIVYVMQDENGDGEPNDTWYELAGSETGKAETWRDYAVTYYRPTASGMSVEWRDNRGNSGVVEYLPTHHDQPSYYPQWIDTPSYTLRGTRLAERNYDDSGNGSHWVQPSYDWGYADNYSMQDGATDTQLNRFRIADAIDHAGRTVRLAYIDFVKVQTACNARSGWLGEQSTEVCGIYDCALLDE